MDSAIHTLNIWDLIPYSIVRRVKGIASDVSSTVSFSNHGPFLVRYRVFLLLLALTPAKLTVQTTIRCLQVSLHQDIAARFLEKIYSHEPGENFTTHTFVGLISAHYENLQDNFFCLRERLVSTDVRVECEGYLFDKKMLFHPGISIIHK